MASTTLCSHVAASVIWNTPKPSRGIVTPLFSVTCCMSLSQCLGAYHRCHEAGYRLALKLRANRSLGLGRWPAAALARAPHRTGIHTSGILSQRTGAPPNPSVDPEPYRPQSSVGSVLTP